MKGTVLSGSPASRLVALAGREGAGLIGSRSRRRAREYFTGNVADRVMKHAPCCLLVYKT